MPNSWVDAEKTADYLARADRRPYRGEGEGVLVRDLARSLPGRVLDLGCGDGRLTALILAAYPTSSVTCVDMSPPMLAAAAARFDGDERVALVAHDLNHELPFDAPLGRRDGCARRPVRCVGRPEQSTRVDQRGRARPRRLHLEMAKPGARARRTPSILNASMSSSSGQTRRRVSLDDRLLSREQDSEG